jgi:hypothetical protein
MQNLSRLDRAILPAYTEYNKKIEEDCTNAD